MLKFLCRSTAFLGLGVLFSLGSPSMQFITTLVALFLIIEGILPEGV